MLGIILTLDYEIHGNGEGCPYDLMVEPTARMLRQFDQYGAKLTILADVAEIIQFQRYYELHGTDRYHYLKIAAQLRDAVQRGHDVQLHLHSSYFNARETNGGWSQDWTEYSFADLPPARAEEMVRAGKAFLESLIQPVVPDYRCSVFRAANWSMHPSRHAIAALQRNGITVDTSVFRHGRRSGLVNFDYSETPSPFGPWRSANDDICRHDPAGPIVEIPIYSEARGLTAFFSLNRLYRSFLSRRHRMPSAMRIPSATTGPNRSLFDRLTRKHAWKADFNQCSGRQLIASLARARQAHRLAPGGPTVPFVLIGHSKLYTRYNEYSLRPFLAHVAADPTHYSFARFSDIALPPRASSPGPGAG
jgi:hypothetical protein